MVGSATIVGSSVRGSGGMVDGISGSGGSGRMAIGGGMSVGLLDGRGSADGITEGRAYTENRASGRGEVVAKAGGRGIAFDIIVGNGDSALSPVNGSGERDRQTGLHHWLHVEPEAPQEVVWLDPYGIDYYITTSTGLKWQIT